MERIFIANGLSNKKYLGEIATRTRYGVDKTAFEVNLFG